MAYLLLFRNFPISIFKIDSRLGIVHLRDDRYVEKCALIAEIVRLIVVVVVTPAASGRAVRRPVRTRPWKSAARLFVYL